MLKRKPMIHDKVEEKKLTETEHSLDNNFSTLRKWWQKKKKKMMAENKSYVNIPKALINFY